MNSMVLEKGGKGSVGDGSAVGKGYWCVQGRCHRSLDMLMSVNPIPKYITYVGECESYSKGQNLVAGSGSKSWSLTYLWDYGQIDSHSSFFYNFITP